MATIQDKKTFAKTVYEASKSLYDKDPKNSLDPIFVTAQAALETGYNLKKATKEYGFNMFGITRGSWTGKVILLLTTEYFDSPNKKFSYPEEKIISVTWVPEQKKYKYSCYRYFRAYNNLGECLDDHLALLRKPMYADAWPYKDDPVEYSKRIVDNIGAKYATGTQYAEAMANIIRELKLMLS